MRNLESRQFLGDTWPPTSDFCSFLSEAHLRLNLDQAKRGTKAAFDFFSSQFSAKKEKKLLNQDFFCRDSNESPISEMLLSLSLKRIKSLVVECERGCVKERERECKNERW